MVVVVVEGDAVAVKAVDVYEGVYKVCVLDCLGRKIYIDTAISMRENAI